MIHRPRADSAAGSEALDQIPDLLQLKRDGVRGDELYVPVSSASSTCNHPDRLFRSAPQPAAHSPLITVSPNDSPRLRSKSGDQVRQNIDGVWKKDGVIKA